MPSPVKSRFASTLLGGWQLSGILSASTGPPFTVFTSGFNAPNRGEQSGSQRPDHVPGRSNNNIVSGTTAGCPGVAAGQKLGTPTRYFDPCAFVLPPPNFYGNLGRDTFIGPGFASLDVSVFKSTYLHITEASRLEFRADFFNLANRANFAIPNGSSGGQVLNPSNRQYIGSAGRITSTVGSSRQLQFGLKVVF